MKLQRLVKLAELGVLRSSNRTGIRAVSDAEKIIESEGLEGSTYDGEVRTLRAKAHLLAGRDSAALKLLNEALAIFETSNDNLMSTYPYTAKLQKAAILKYEKDKLPALLEYQEVMQNVEGKVPSDHPYVQSAFTNWMALRGAMEDEGRLKEAEAAGLCECWPFEDYKDKLVPLNRPAPVMPTGFERGNHSGYVQVKFDVDEMGKTYNIKSVYSTSSLLNKSAIASVAKWQFSKKITEEPEGSRKGVSNKITFKLLDERGNILPEPKL